MNVEMEALLRALDAVIEARSAEEASRLQHIYKARLDDIHERYPGVSSQKLQRFVDTAYLRWANLEEKKHTSIPPQA